MIKEDLEFVDHVRDAMRSGFYIPEDPQSIMILSNLAKDNAGSTHHNIAFAALGFGIALDKGASDSDVAQGIKSRSVEMANRDDFMFKPEIVKLGGHPSGTDIAQTSKTMVGTRYQSKAGIDALEIGGSSNRSRSDIDMMIGSIDDEIHRPATTRKIATGVDFDR